jgi:chromosome segregation ATPase
MDMGAKYDRLKQREAELSGRIDNLQALRKQRSAELSEVEAKFSGIGASTPPEEVTALIASRTALQVLVSRCDADLERLVSERAAVRGELKMLTDDLNYRRGRVANAEREVEAARAVLASVQRELEEWDE